MVQEQHRIADKDPFADNGYIFCQFRARAGLNDNVLRHQRQAAEQWCEQDKPFVHCA